MKKTDIELIIKLQSIFDKYIDDQEKTEPLHKLEYAPSSIHGSLADLLFVDKVDNDALVNFIGMLVGQKKGTTDAEILKTLKDVSHILHAFNFEADDTGKAH